MPKLRLDKMEDVTSSIRLMTFRAADGGALDPFEAGAHLDFDLGAAGLRAYSLIDWSKACDAYVVAVQREDAGQGGSQAMHALALGELVEASTPANDFPLRDGPAPVLLLAGGIGITPMISMATALQQTGRPFALHYAGRSLAVMGFTEALRQSFGGHVTLHPDDDGPLDLAALMGAQPKDTHLYICGPKGMIDAARSAAEQAGLTEIHVELFATPEAEDDDKSFEVEVNDGQVFTVAPGRSIIDALEAGGVDVMYDCQRGDCGICQCDVLAGVPDHRDVVLSDAERESGKVMQICVSRAKSDRLVLDI